jgi:hypothetical protein
MKKVILLFFAALCTFGAQAQEFKYGVTAGMNVSKPSNYNSRVGFSVGAKGELSFANSIYVGAGLSLSSKGGKSDGYYDATKKISSTWKTMPYYLEMPVYVGYKAPVAENVKLFGNVGPYIGLGLFGKNKVTNEAAEKKTVTTTDNVFKDKLQERFDWGFGANVGVELFNHYQVSLGYSLGMKNVYKKDTNLDSKNRVFNISFAYMF